MKPYYQQDGITIYHGDCRVVMSCLPSFALLLTDPPYGIGCDVAIHIEKPSRPSTYTSGPKYVAGDWDALRPSVDVFTQMLGKTSDQIIWGGNYFADMLPPSGGWLFWDKLFDKTFNLSHGELAWTSFERRLLKFTMSSKAETHGGRLREHPTQKPEALMRWCLSLAPDGSVLDPFMGTGTSLVAAKRLGRCAVGIELDERYCEIAARRLSQGSLFGVAQDGEASTGCITEQTL
jgi:DNA modification methylase